MVLLEWAKLGRPEPFSACLPLDNGEAVVCRGRFFRHLEIGPLAHIHAVHLDAAQVEALGGRTELLLANIPVPETETTDFANQTIALPAPGPEGQGDDLLSLSWCDRLVIVEPPVLLDSVLTGCLASIPTSALRRRVRGWTTSAELPPRGAINPLRQCQLVLSRDMPERDISHLRLARVTADGRLAADKVLPPPSYGAWQAFAGLKTLEGQPLDAIGAGWDAALTGEEPGEVVARLARAASQSLPASAMIPLLREMAASGEPAMAEAGHGVMTQYVGALGSQGVAADVLVSFLRSVSAGERRHVPALVEALSGQALPELAATDLEAALSICLWLLGEGRDLLSPGLQEAMARIVVHAARNAAPGDNAIDIVARVLDLWPGDSRSQLNQLADTRVITGFAGYGGQSMLERLTRTVFAAPRALLARNASDHDGAVRAMRALVMACSKLGGNHG